VTCPKCGSDKTYKNGAGRSKCKDCRGSFITDVREEAREEMPIVGLTTLYGEEGQVKQEWVRRNQTAERQLELMREAVLAMAETIKRAAPVKGPKSSEADLLSCYIVTDYHLGMLSWHEETGDDWDTQIAERLLVRWFAQAIELTPRSEVGVFAQLGDMLHWDGLDAVTPASKHVLDADTRFQKVVRVAIRVIRQIVAMLLAKHARVILLMAEGNHDPASSIWLRELFSALYEDEPRIKVELSPDPYYCIEHGDTSLFFHHGHKRKPENVSEVFAAKFREVFGRTKHSYAHMGHKHHVDAKENNLMVVEQHRTLAASDAYSSRAGFISGRDAKVVTYHKKWGEVSRSTVNSDMVSA